MDCARHLSGLFFRPRSNAGAGSVFATHLSLPSSGALTGIWRFAMNKDQMKGTAEKVKGKVNEAVGNATDDPAQKAKGQVQQGVGEAQKQYGDLKEDVKKGKA
jgi:uncharacterized protein YjbJ (UPF0337 family)